MRKSLAALAILVVAASPALAQTGPAESEPAAKSKTVKKTVCRRIKVEGATGSRVGSTTKVCKTIDVPAPADKDAISEPHKDGARQAL